MTPMRTDAKTRGDGMAELDDELTGPLGLIEAMFRDIGPEGPHADHEWREVPPCVYCVTCDQRLYQGSIPEWKDPALAAKRAVCAHENHEGYDDGDGWREMGEGFYWVCADCGFKGWYE